MTRIACFQTLTRCFTTAVHSRLRLNSTRISSTPTRAQRFGLYERIVPSDLRTKPVIEWQQRPVPDSISKPCYALSGEIPTWAPEVHIHDANGVQRMREAGALAHRMLALASQLCSIGITTDEIDAILHKEIVAAGAYPSPLNYGRFPKSVCTSINNIIAHGIPNSRPLKDGDIINIDITVYLNGYHGDTSATFLVGHVDEQGLDLTNHTKEALACAIAVCGPGVEFKRIGEAISSYADKHNLTVSPELCGHGIGLDFHALPLVYHHRNNESGRMLPNMTFTIEPILCQGSPLGVIWPDGLTVATADGGRSAQFEHTVLITNDGIEVLTA